MLASMAIYPELNCDGYSVEYLRQVPFANIFGYNVNADCDSFVLIAKGWEFNNSDEIRACVNWKG